MSLTKIFEYAVIGAGPAAICAIPNIIHTGVSGNDICWIDNKFNVGDFGTILSRGSSVPGNSRVQTYQNVNQAIYQMVPACKPDHAFELDSLAPDYVCSIKVAAKPLQYITDRLRTIVHSQQGIVSDIITSNEGSNISIRISDDTVSTIMAKRVILATGSIPKTLELPSMHKTIKIIDPNITFIQSEVTDYLQKNSDVKKVAVIGSSHSAALATMHLLKAGIPVKQFMNKEYKFAAPAIGPHGEKYTMFDNTGLKGDVALFTRQLLNDVNSEYQQKLMFHIGKDREDITQLLEANLFDCTHAIAAVGYQPSATLRINNIPLSEYQHDSKTTEIIGVNGVFGIGIAFPEKKQAISGEIEFAVGVGKFWDTASNPDILNTWGNV